MKELIYLTQVSLFEKEDIKTLFEKALKISEKHFHLGRGELILFEEGLPTLYLFGDKKKYEEKKKKINEAVATGQVIVENKSGSESNLYVPLYREGKVCGVIKFSRDFPFADDDLKTAEIFSAIVSVMIVHSELRKNLEEKFRKLEVLYNIGKELREKVSIDVLLNAIVEIIRSVFEIDNVAVLLKDKDNNLKIYAASFGYETDFVKGKTISITKGEGITGLAAKERRIIISNDTKTDPRYVDGNKKTRSEMAVPLIHKEKLLGVLDLESNVKNRFTEDDKKILEAVADEISVAIENALLYEKLKELAEKDELTGLYNYRAFRKELDREISRGLRYNKKFSLVMFDIDYFKDYNDNNGHDMGNVVLHKVGAILRKATRKTDFPARFGGEEFIIILPETGKGGAFVFAERIRATIENERFPGEEKQPGGKLTVSGGVAEFPLDGDTAEKIIKAVDIAAYKAKNNGRNRIEIFQKERKE